MTATINDLYLFSQTLPSVCCPPLWHKATAPSALEILCATRLEPSVTNTYDDCFISVRWTLNLPCGRCFICLRRHSEFIETSTTGNRQRTSGPGTILLSLSCWASGCVVRMWQSQGLVVPLFCFFVLFFNLISSVSTVGFGLVLDMGFLETLKLLVWVVFVDCIGVGLFISTVMWWVTL